MIMYLEGSGPVHVVGVDVFELESLQGVPETLLDPGGLVVGGPQLRKEKLKVRGHVRGQGRLKQTLVPMKSSSLLISLPIISLKTSPTSVSLR